MRLGRLTRIELVLVGRRQIRIGVLAEMPRLHHTAPASRNSSTARANASGCSICGAWPAAAIVVDACVRQQPCIGREILGGHQAVALAAQEQRRRSDPMQPVAQLGIVHVRLPDQQRERLAIARLDRELVRRSGARDRPACAPDRGTAARSSSSCGIAKMSGMSSLIDWTDLHADRGRPAPACSNAFRRFGGNFGGDPAADRAADHVDLSQPQPVEQFEIDVGDVVAPNRSSRAGWIVPNPGCDGAISRCARDSRWT